MDILPNYVTGIVAVLLFSSFVKIATTLSILRFGVGLSGAGFSLAILALSVALSMMVMQPFVEKAGGVDVVFSQGALQNPAQIDANFRPFLEKNTDQKVLRSLRKLSEKLRTSAARKGKSKVAQDQSSEPSGEDQKEGLAVLASAFLLSELKVAFQLGFIILIPFLVIDLLVANALLVLGAGQVSHMTVAIPLKILLFFALDGWLLISQRLIGTYL